MFQLMIMTIIKMTVFLGELDSVLDQFSHMKTLDFNVKLEEQRVREKVFRPTLKSTVKEQKCTRN
jgi:hypothetical protein